MTIFIIVLGSLQARASDVDQTITLSFKDAPLVKVFNQIRKQTDYSFLMDERDLKKTSPISILIKNGTIEEVLNQCIKGQPISYKIIGKLIVIVAPAVSVPAPKIQDLSSVSAVTSISGRVLNEKEDPLPGVSVVLRGTRKGTATDEAGSFTIVASAGDVLDFSIVGYKKTSVIVRANPVINVKMELEVATAEEMVVVGYGTKKKVNLTGAVSVVKGSDIENRPVLNATQSLQGMVPGLNVSVGGNTKPGQSFNLNIRGTGNLSGGDGPFVLVDGIAMSLSDVNPSDIESISVLKDAAASAVYGARAPYGVILVTTKKGKADKTTISYSNNFGLTSPINLPDMANSYDFAQYFNAATFNAQGSRQYSDQKLALLKQYVENPAGMSIFPEVSDNFYSNWENSANGVANTNWFDFNYKPYATRQLHNLSVSGGNKATQYFISGGYYSEGGIMRYADINFKRYNLNATISSQLTNWASIRLNTKFTQSKYTAPFNGTFESLFFHNLARMRPNVSPYDLNGNFNEMSSVPYLRSGSKDEVDNYTLVLLPAIELEPVKDWKIITEFNIRRDNAEETVLKLPGLIYGIDGTPKYVNRSEFAIPLLGSFSRNVSSSVYVSPNIYSTYNYTLKDKHFFNIMAGFQQELNEFNSLSSSAQDLISAGRPGISLTTGTPTTQEVRNHWATRGFFGRLNYNYEGKYLVELNGRYDGSSRFAAGNRWGFFPSMSVGYNLAKENFMKPYSNIINLLKIRGSYGLLGNQSGAGLYSYAQSMNITVPALLGAGGTWYFQNGREAYISAPAPFNAFTTWEKVQTSNVGIDFELLRNRLSGSIDIFQRSTKDMLGPTLDIADMFGGVSPPSNNANLRTSGWELTINWKGKIGSNIDYSIGALLSDYKAVVTKYQNPTNSSPNVNWYEGKKVGEIWGYTASGLIQTKEEADAFNGINHSYLSAVAWVPGDVNYLDLNKDKALNIGSNKLGDMGDLSIIGNSSPRYSYSFNGSISWKGLSLYVLLQGIGKMDYAPGVGDVYFWGSGALAQVTVFKQHLDYWTKDNPGAYYPNPYSAPAGSIAAYASKTQQISNLYIQNAAYLRLKNSTLAYTLPLQLIRRAKLKKVNLFITGENLFTITKLARMFDPETLVGGVSTGKVYPLNRVYSMGLNITL